MFGWLRRVLLPPTAQQRRMRQLLAGYPLYAPPAYKGDSTIESARAASAEYAEYFHDIRPARLEALRTFLENFGVSLNTDDAGLMAVSAWLPEWADLLIEGPYNKTIWYAYLRLQVAHDCKSN